MLAVAAISFGYFASSSAQEFSTGYRAETSLPSGMIVSLESREERLVVPANRDNIDNLLGVTVGGSNSLLNLSSQESNVQVVTNGIVEVLVTDINGRIETGDFVTISEVNGIGRKATREDPKILGTAQGNFEESSLTTVTTASGASREVSVSRIDVLIQVGGNPDLARQESFLPGFLQEAANTLAGEPVSPARIIVSVVVVVGGIIGSMVLLYGAVSSTIISIGRNPLSDKSIYAGLLRMTAIAVIIILISCTLAYAIILV